LSAYVVLIHQRHRRADGQTDGQTTYDRKTAFCTVVHRTVNTLYFLSFGYYKGFKQQKWTPATLKVIGYHAI